MQAIVPQACTGMENLLFYSYNPNKIGVVTLRKKYYDSTGVCMRRYRLQQLS